MQVQQADGQIKALPPVTPAPWVPATFDYDAAPITGLVFGHASTDPNSTDPTVIKRLIFTPGS
jgi:hypothetical protein